MNKKYIIANWKMYPISLSDAISYDKNFITKKEWPEEAEIIICPPFPYLSAIKSLTLGAQDCSNKESGAHTGEVSAFILKELGVKYVIIGHSERRDKESNEVIKEKMNMALSQGITPVLCVGEPLEVYKAGDSMAYVKQQLKECQPKKGVILAYEPIWAIGSGLTPTPDEIGNFALELKKEYDMPLLYGGSVSADFAFKLAKIYGINGVLVGYASTQPKEFEKIIFNFCKSNA